MQAILLYILDVDGLTGIVARMRDLTFLILSRVFLQDWYITTYSPAKWFTDGPARARCRLLGSYGSSFMDRWFVRSFDTY